MASPLMVIGITGRSSALESTHPEIAYAVHQCARVSSNLMESHANAVRYLCRSFLAGTKNKGLILQADPSNSFEVHVDCDFAGNWVEEDATKTTLLLPNPEPDTSLAMVVARSSGHPSLKVR